MNEVETAQKILKKLTDVPDTHEIAAASKFKDEEYFDLDAICTAGELRALMEAIIDLDKDDVWRR